MLKIQITIAIIFTLISCAKSSDAGTAASSTTSSTTQTCRTYATNITDTTNTITYSCTFNGTTTLTCTNGGTETITSTYANVQAFVDEAASPLSVFNKVRVTQMVFASATPSLQHNITITYNGSNQPTSVTDVAAATTTSYTYTAWDGNNRQTAGTAQFTAGATCTGRILSFTYVDGSTRTNTTNASGGTGANCAGLNPSITQQDANGNLLQFVSRNYTINSTATKCY
jgi:hypothetical protein